MDFARDQDESQRESRRQQRLSACATNHIVKFLNHGSIVSDYVKKQSKHKVRRDKSSFMKKQTASTSDFEPHANYFSCYINNVVQTPMSESSITTKCYLAKSISPSAGAN